MQLKRKSATNSPKIKPIPKYSNKHRELDKIFEHIEFEKKRKEILKTLPENSFAKKFYYNKNLHNEILLLKIGNEIFDISKDRTRGQVDNNETLLLDLSKKYDLSKAIQIHQHLAGAISTASAGDFLDFLQTYKKWGIKKQYVLPMDSNLKEMGRIRYELTPKLMKKLDNLSYEQIEVKYGDDIKRWFYGCDDHGGLSLGESRICEWLGIKETIKPAKGWKVKGREFYTIDGVHQRFL